MENNNKTSGSQSASDLINLIDSRSKKVFNSASESFVKVKIGVVLSYDSSNGSAVVHFPEDGDNSQFSYYNKTSEALSEGDNVKIYYTTNPAKGWIGARCGEPSVKETTIYGGEGVGRPSPWDNTSEYFNYYDEKNHNVAGDSTLTGSLYATARGYYTQATGYCSCAEGGSSKATGNYSHAEGAGTQATGGSSHAEGGGTTASGNDSHAEGGSTKASGNYSHAEGSDSSATAYCAHAEGGSTKATQQYAHSEGCGTKATGCQAHVEGLWSEASGNSSHAEGEGCKSIGYGSHAQGMNCVASGFLSHAGGRDSTAGLPLSFAHGTGLQTAENGQISTALFGEYNDYSDTNVIFAVGNGSSNSSRSNAFAVDKEGNIYCKSIIQTGATAAASLLSDDSDDTPTYTAQSDNVVEYDGVTYTFTVADTGAYTGVTTSTGKSMAANIPAGLGNIQTHNAAFMALAMMTLK